MAYYDKVIRVQSNEIKQMPPNETVSFEKPKIVGCFSLDVNRKYIPDTTNMMYYFPREDKIYLDLNYGIERVVRKDDYLNEKLDNLGTFIMNNFNNLSMFDEETNRKTLDADFVCYRGLLTQIMCCLHEKKKWSISATKYKGTIYLHLENVEQFSNISPKENEKFCSWGFKFEQYMLTDEVGVCPDSTKPVNEAEEFCCIFKSKLGSHKILYGAEMDGILSDTAIDKNCPDWDNLEFIELKTAKKRGPISNDNTLKIHKFIKWWAQSFLVNVQRIYCGFRSHDGIVREVVPFLVRELPKLSKNSWNWRTCLNFCNIFLNIVKDVIPKETNDKHTVWTFTWNPQNEEFTYKKVEGKSTSSFLPDWYNI